MQEHVTVHRIVRTCKLEGQYVPPHTHTFFHFIYYFGGHARVCVDGREHSAQRGTLVMVPPGQIHSIISLDTSTSLDIKFTCSHLLAQRIRALPLCVGSVSGQADAILRNVLEEAAGQAPGYQEMVDLRLYELVLTLERMEAPSHILWQQRDYPLQEEGGETLGAALGWIETHLECPLRVSDLASHCGYSANYFRLFFKERMGVTPNAYINQRKIARAKEWMLYSDWNITQIAQHLGFQSIHYFSRLFKKLVGISPTEYIGRVKSNRPINLVHNENTPAGEFEVPVRSLRDGPAG